MEMTELGTGISYLIQGKTLTVEIDLSQTLRKGEILKSTRISKPLSYHRGQVFIAVNVYKQVKRR